MSDKKFRIILVSSFALLITWAVFSHNSQQTGEFSVAPPDNPGKLSVFELARSLRKTPHQSGEEVFADEETQRAFLRNTGRSGTKSGTTGPGEESDSNQKDNGKKGGSAPEGDLWSFVKDLEESGDKNGGSDKKWTWQGNGFLTSGENDAPETEGESDRENTRPDNSGEKVRVVYVSSDQKGQKSSGGQKKTGTVNEADILLAMADSRVNEVIGRTDSHGSGNLLKLGSEYLGVIRDAIEISTGEKQNLIVDVVGRLSPHTVNQPFKMFAEAGLSSNGSRIIIRVKQCIDPDSSARGLKCSGDIKGIDGRDGLRGEIYNPSVWASIVRTAGTLLSQYSLSSMTSSLTQGGVIMDQNQSNKILQSLASGWQALGNELASQINSHGKSVSVAGGSVVRVLVTEDSELW